MRITTIIHAACDCCDWTTNGGVSPLGYPMCDRCLRETAEVEKRGY